MTALLSNFRNTIIVSVVLALIMVAGYYVHRTSDGAFYEAVFRWMHVFFGILWIGLLYYFNFVQIRVMPNIPAELKPAVSKYIAPEALFWFRWAALATWVMGVILAIDRGYLLQAITLGFSEHPINPQHTFIGVGMWLGLIMAFNVWFIIWPAQKKILGIIQATAEEKAAAAPRALFASRTNLLLSLGMLYCMSAANTLIG